MTSHDLAIQLDGQRTLAQSAQHSDEAPILNEPEILRRLPLYAARWEWIRTQGNGQPVKGAKHLESLIERWPGKSKTSPS